MARGWESKAVEEQRDLSGQERLPHSPNAAQAADRDLLIRRESLQLSRERILREWNETAHPRRRAQLAEALAYLEQQLAQLPVPR